MIGKPLHDQVVRLGSRMRRLSIFGKLGWWLAVGIWAALVIGGLDYVLRIDDAGIRFLLSVAFAALVIGLLVRAIAGTRAVNVLDVARRIEFHFPQLADRLTSAVEFAQGTRSINSGSVALQKRVVAAAWADVQQLDLGQCVDKVPAKRGAMAAGAALLAITILAIGNAPVLGIAVQRLANPWGGPAWPRQNSLRYVTAPRQIARGSTAVIRVEDQKGRLPKDGLLEISYATEGPGETESAKVMAEAGALTATIENVSRDLKYRMSAGDDELPWVQLAIAEPAVVDTWRLQLVAPQYAGGEITDVSERGSALVGSELRFSGSMSRPMSQGSLMGTDGQRWPLKFDSTGMDFTLANVVILSSPTVVSLWLECTEPHDIARRIGPQVEIQVVADTPPTISWERPRVSHVATPRSTLPLQGIAKDNAGVARIVAVFEFDNSLQRVRDLGASIASPDVPGSLPKVVDFDERIELAPWGLRAGDQCRVMIRCEDAQSDHAGLTETPWRQVQIVTLEQLMQLAASRQAEIFQMLQQQLSLQRSTQDRARELLQDLAGEPNITASRRESLQSIELEQRRIIQGLGVRRPTERVGLLGMITEVLGELELTGEVTEVRRRLSDLHDAIAKVVGQHVDDVERNLIASLQTAEIGKAATTSLTHLQHAVDSQSSVIVALESLLADAKQWTSFQDAAQELSKLIELQQSLGRKMDASLVQQLMEPEDDSLAGEAAAQADEQRALGRRLDKLLAGLEQLAERLAVKERDAILQAVRNAERMRLASLTREIASNLQEQNWGVALEEHQQLLAGLRTILGQLTATQTGEAASALQLAKQLEKLADSAEKNAATWESGGGAEVAQQSVALANEMREAADVTMEVDPAASELLGVAAILMTQAGLEAANPETAAANAASAARQVQQAIRQLRESAGDAASLTREMLASLQAIVGRQKFLRDAAMALPESPSLEDCISLRQQQQQLIDELHSRDSAWERSPILRTGLLAAEPAMRAAADELELRSLEPAVRNMGLALGKLDSLHRALVGERAKREPGNDSDDATGAEDGAGSRQGPVAPSLKLAELKVLLIMQESITQRTMELEQVKGTRPLGAGELQEQTELAQRQGKLAVWIQGLIEQERPAPTKPDESPEPKSAIDQLLEGL